MFKEPNKHRFESRHQKRECGASLNVQEHRGDKKIDMDENLQPKHIGNRYTIHKWNTRK